MADRGFQIKDLLTLKGAYLNMPPFTHERRNGKGRVLSSNRFLKPARLLLYASMWNGLSEDSNPTKC